MNITIFGTGYVGLVTAACFADAGHQVACIDIDHSRIAELSKGKIPIFEPGLDPLISSNLQAGRLKFTTDAAAAVAFGELQFIAVGTPEKSDGSTDLHCVIDAATTIAKHLKRPAIIVNKSTVPVGTAALVEETITRTLREREFSVAFEVCANPEFLKEGAAIEDFTKAARIIVGTDSEHVKSSMQQCYQPFNRNHDKFIFMDTRSAELTKYAANAMLATKISFMSELATLAEHINADIEQVRLGIGADPRIGYHFIYPGCGYGGSCLTKDIRALTTTAQNAGYDPVLLKAVETVNIQQKKTLFEKLFVALNGTLEGRTIAIWGLSFKPNTDDMRDAPSCSLMEALWQAGAKVQAFDPIAADEARRMYEGEKNLKLVESRDLAIRGADALVICTEWPVFRAVDFACIKQELSAGVIVDGRNLYDPKTVKAAGLSYYAVGRGDSLVAKNIE